MLTASFDFPALAIVVGGTFLAGFTTGFAGFGTGLVASGLWFHALPAAMVPPLVALASVAAQLVGMMTVREAFNWRRVAPFLLGGVLGVPPGVAALTAVSPVVLKLFVGVFLTAYAMYQLGNRIRWHIGQWGGGIADGFVGLGGGLLGGFAGLSAPLPVMWLQLRGGSRQQQRALYQPFNMVVLALASLGMVVQRAGHGGRRVGFRALPAGDADRRMDRRQGLCRRVGADLSKGRAQPAAPVGIDPDRPGLHRIAAHADAACRPAR
jgi:uncharacterized protein